MWKVIPLLFCQLYSLLFPSFMPPKRIDAYIGTFLDGISLHWEVRFDRNHITFLKEHRKVGKKN